MYDNDTKIVEFNFDFSSGKIDLRNLKIEYVHDSFSAIYISGLNLSNATKTVWIKKVKNIR